MVKIPKINELLAYETGVHIGDGNLYSKKRTHKITYSGNLRDEKVYYENVLIPTIQELYDVIPSKYEIEHKNVILVVINSKKVAEFKMNCLDLPNGKKNQIKIPEIIKKNDRFLIKCLRGLGDTDFSLSFKKNKKGIHCEPRIELFSRSKLLILDVEWALKKFNFNPSVELDKKREGYIENRLRLYGNKNLQSWMKIIGFSNSFKILKYKVYKKFKQVPPKLSHAQLMKLLNSY